MINWYVIRAILQIFGKESVVDQRFIVTSLRLSIVGVSTVIIEHKILLLLSKSLMQVTYICPSHAPHITIDMFYRSFHRVPWCSFSSTRLNWCIFDVIVLCGRTKLSLALRHRFIKTHRRRGTHIYGSNKLVARSAPSHYLNHYWNIVNSNLRNTLQWNLKRNSYIFIQENACENIICEMAAISSRPQCVNTRRL